MTRKGLFVGLLVVSVLIATAVSGAFAATRDEIEDAVSSGVAWLAGRQNPDNGSWGDWEQAAKTCFVLVKLEERAHDLGYASPFDPAYPYSENVIRGWKYIFGTPHIHQYAPLSVQWHNGNPDNPDTNANRYGLYFDTWGSHPAYTTGICLMALAASGTPDRANDGGLDFNGDGNADTFKEIAQDTADWLALAQGDSGNDEGGWGYSAIDNGSDGWTDNSNSGYAMLGLAYAEAFGRTVPGWVRTELNVWIGTIQDPVNGDQDDGGSYYNPDWLPGNPWVNELKAGNLIFEMTFYGDDPSAPRFGAALDYVVRHWQDQNIDPGWGYKVNPANYQAMYTLMKGFEYSRIDRIDLDVDGTPEHDWFDEFSTVLVGQQNPDGSWPGWCNWGDDVLCTTWALLTLEKVAPVIEVPVDIKPRSCPNPLNVADKGTLPVAILGSERLDVTRVDPATVRLEGIAPLRWSLEDVAAPYVPYIGKRGAYDCTTAGPDGYMDLSLKFQTQAVVAALGAVSNRDVLVLQLTGNLKAEFGGGPIVGEDVVVILKKAK